MTELMRTPEIEHTADRDGPVDEAELAAAAFLARYRGRTLEAYRYDLRAFFQWAADDRLDILKATRPQIELYVRAIRRPGRCGDEGGGTRTAVPVLPPAGLFEGYAGIL